MTTMPQSRVATGLTAGARKHPGETWEEIPAVEHAARALRHLSLYLKGDTSEEHLVNASMRCMMAWVMVEQGYEDDDLEKEVYKP